ncbi:MAG: hypothetical protein AAGC55_01555 [Myxococcota bacterium]
MRAITMFRAMAWLGVAIIFWSLNVQWGVDADVRAGPPAVSWERLVVGAGVLALIAALSLSVSGRKQIPPSWRARGIAGICALLAVVIALHMRFNLAIGARESAVEGAGWMWLLCGGGIAVGAVLGTFGLKAPIRRTKRGKRRR